VQTNGAAAGGFDVFILRRVAAGGKRILSDKSPFPFEAWCRSTGIAVPFSCHSHGSGICVALNKRWFYKTPERTAVCFSSFVFILYFYFSFFSSLFLSVLYFFFCSVFYPPFSSSSCVPLYFFLFYSFFTLNFYHLNVSYIFSQTRRTFSIELRLSSFVFGNRRACYWKFCSYLRYVQVGVPYRKIPMWSPLVHSLS
jgi:hypothetical protein